MEHIKKSTILTDQNDRWDSITYKFYKNPTYYEEIIKANPDDPYFSLAEFPPLQEDLKYRLFFQGFYLAFSSI